MNRPTNLLLIATILVASLLLTLPAQAASSSLAGEVFVAAGTSGTNALPASRTTNTTVLVQSTAGDGTNAVVVNAAVTHTSSVFPNGNLFQVQNNSTNVFRVYDSISDKRYTTMEVGAIGSGSAAASFTVVNDGSSKSSTLNLGVSGAGWSFNPYASETAALLLLTGPGGADMFLADPAGDWGASYRYLFGTSSTVSSGNLVEVQNNGTKVFELQYNGTLYSYGDADTELYLLNTNNNDFAELFPHGLAIVSGGSTVVQLNPSTASPTTPHFVGTDDVHAGGNLFEVRNGPSTMTHGFTYDAKLNLNGPAPELYGEHSITFAYFDINPTYLELNDGMNALLVADSGKVTARAGFGSTATDAAVTIAATGWTNTFAKNAVVYFSGTNVTYTVFNNALTSVYTNLNTTGMINSTVILQPSGKVIISGTDVFGRATPF